MFSNSVGPQLVSACCVLEILHRQLRFWKIVQKSDPFWLHQSFPPWIPCCPGVALISITSLHQPDFFYLATSAWSLAPEKTWAFPHPEIDQSVNPLKTALGSWPPWWAVTLRWRWWCSWWIFSGSHIENSANGGNDNHLTHRTARCCWRRWKTMSSRSFFWAHCSHSDLLQRQTTIIHIHTCIRIHHLNQQQLSIHNVRESIASKKHLLKAKCMQVEGNG